MLRSAGVERDDVEQVAHFAPVLNQTILEPVQGLTELAEIERIDPIADRAGTDGEAL